MKCVPLIPVLVLAVVVLAGGCTTPNPDYDPGGWGPGWALVDGWSYTPGEGGGPGPADTAGGATDGGSAAKDAKPATPDKPPAPPFGQLCTGPGTCPDGELCLFAEADATKGICLRKCDTADAPCSVPDPKYYSGCAVYWNSDVGKVKLCVIFCKSPDKTYPCPNATDYKCKSYGPQMGMCVPK
jgi:hypothetical protein